ncbi:MAG: diguanylate cyclase [Colwellia sp.]|nr:diguanylate cyclase [Colwellia sp.]
MKVLKLLVSKKWLFILSIYCCLFAVTNSVLANDLKVTLNAIQPSHDYDCPVDKIFSDKVKWLLVNTPNLSNQEMSKLMWKKSTTLYCNEGFSENYIHLLEQIILLPNDEVNHNLLSISIFDLATYYSNESQRKSCDFLHKQQLLLPNASKEFLRYVDLAEIQYCSENNAIDKLKKLFKILELNKEDDNFTGTVYYTLAETYSSLGQFSLAANIYKKQLPLIDNDFDKNRAYYIIVTELFKAGEIEESKFFFRKYESVSEKLKNTDNYKISLAVLKIKFAYIEKKFGLMMELIDEFEPYQKVAQERFKNNKINLFKAIACLENNRTECVNTFISKIDLLIKESPDSNLLYLNEFLTKYYISQNKPELSKKHFENYIKINQQDLMHQQSSISILGAAELQQDIVELELGLVSAKLEKSKIILILSSLIIFILVTICLFIWRQKSIQKILSETDELTRIFNRRAIFEQITNLKDTQNNEIHAIILFDLDHFKLINDKYSHISGDKALRHIVKLTKINIRQQDLFGRIGGEEFVVCLKNLKKESAQIIVERIRSCFENNSLLIDNEIELKVTASFSITYINKSISSFEILYQKLDDALYKAKDLGRNRVVET